MLARTAEHTTLDKLNYNKNKIKPVPLLFLLFSTMVAGLLLSLVFFHPTVPPFSPDLAAILVIMVIVSFGQNLFDYVGLSTKNLSLREPINNLQPILASFLAYLLFPSERKTKYVVAILIGVIVLYVGSSNRKLRLTIDRGTVYLFLGVVCSAVLASIYKFGLETVPPVYLLLLRATGVLLLLQLSLKPALGSLTRNQASLGVGAGVIYIIGNLSQLYSIRYLGLNLTILIFLLGPGLIYTCSSLVLKEKVQLRQIATSVILIGVIIWVTYL